MEVDNGQHSCCERLYCSENEHKAKLYKTSVYNTPCGQYYMCCVPEDAVINNMPVGLLVGIIICGIAMLLACICACCRCIPGMYAFALVPCFAGAGLLLNEPQPGTCPCPLHVPMSLRVQHADAEWCVLWVSHGQVAT